MSSDQSFPVGVCVFPEPDLNRPHTIAYPHYIHEILGHAGLCYTTLAPGELEQSLDRVRILVTVGERDLPPTTKAKLQSWVNEGGAWLSIAGICGLRDLLGADLPPAFQGFGAGVRTLGEGYLKAESSHILSGHLTKPLHYFNGLSVITANTGKTIAKALDAHGRPTDQPLVIENASGKGRTILVAVDITGTVVHVQQGCAVTRDGIPAPDGSAPVSDAVLKSGDGGVLDWIFDRDEVPGSPGFKAFLHPVADLWRELLLRSILHLAQQQNVPLPILWLWPRNLPAVAHMSHDTDGNDPALGRKLLDLLQQARINSTWCVILPGYEADIMTAIKTAGHELATHYDAMTGGLPWSEQQFDRQHRQLLQLFGEIPVSNKNHFLRWEGDIEFFEWCAKRGIQLDQSKGASKTGEAGFNFGTCHVFRPIRFNGYVIDVLEMATPTQDLNVFAPETLLEPLLDSSIKNHGIYHLLFHPAHVHKDDVCKAILRAAKTAKDRGLEWWTARQINDWQRARGQVRWSDYNDRGVTLQAAAELNDATILWLAPGAATSKVTRWGFGFQSQSVSVSARSEKTLALPVGGS